MDSQATSGELTENTANLTVELAKKKYKLKSALEDLETRLRSRRATLMDLRSETTALKAEKASLEEKVESAREALERTVAAALTEEWKMENTRKDYRTRIEEFITAATDYARNLEEALFGNGGDEVPVDPAGSRKETREMRENALRAQIEVAQTLEGYQQRTIAQLEDMEKFAKLQET